MGLCGLLRGLQTPAGEISLNSQKSLKTSLLIPLGRSIVHYKEMVAKEKNASEFTPYRVNKHRNHFCSTQRISRQFSFVKQAN